MTTSCISIVPKKLHITPVKEKIFSQVIFFLVIENKKIVCLNQRLNLLLLDDINFKLLDIQIFNDNENEVIIKNLVQIKENIIALGIISEIEGKIIIYKASINLIQDSLRSL